MSGSNLVHEALILSKKNGISAALDQVRGKPRRSERGRIARAA